MNTSPDDTYWMRRAIDLSRQCPPSTSAYNVGAIIVSADGRQIATGYSRDSDPYEHAEESALGKLALGDPRLDGATIYSSLEPCSERRSRHQTCVQLILKTGISRVVIAWREPSHFVPDAQGVELLVHAGITVAELPELEAAVRAANDHLPAQQARG